MSENLKKESYIRNIKIIAIRGNYSLQRIIKNGQKISNSVVLADPGILFPLIYDLIQLNAIEKKHELCVIPHYIDKTNILIKTKIKINNFLILNITDNPSKFIFSLLRCKRVLSSSLHGLIISDSLGIPNMRMLVSNKIGGGNYKFKDYYSAYNFDLPMKIDLRKTFFTEKQLKNIDSNHKISDIIIRKKQCQLIINFPYRLKKNFDY